MYLDLKRLFSKIIFIQIGIINTVILLYTLDICILMKKSQVSLSILKYASYLASNHFSGGSFFG